VVPEAVLAPTTIPIGAPPAVTPLIDLPGPVSPAQAPVYAVSPQDANAAVPQYPGIPEPGQDLVSLQATVVRLKEIVEMMTGTRAEGSETDIVGGHLLLQKSTANSSARLEIINQVTANANFAFATQITTLSAEFKNYTGVDPTGTTFNAALREDLQVYADADEALALRTLQLESALVMNPTTHASARLATIESTNVTQGTNITANANSITTLDAQINVGPSSVTAKLEVTAGVAVTAQSTANAANATANTANTNAGTALLKYGVQGTINGISGGFTFSGVLKNDGSVGYFMEFNVGSFILRNPNTGGAASVFDFDGSRNQFTFNGNVIINGSLILNGSLITDKIGAGQVTGSLASTGTDIATVTMYLRNGAKVNIIGSYRGYPAIAPLGFSGSLTISASNGFSDSSPIGFAFLYTPAGGVSFPVSVPTMIQSQFTAFYEGWHDISVSHSWIGSFGVNIIVMELAR
jgi:hypothetical protein